MIKINCQTQDYLEYSKLTEFQGGLKIRDDSDIDKAVRSIKKHGWEFPLFVWKKGKINYVLDGHCRLLACQRLIAEGEHIPPLPVVYIKCKNEDEAKEILLKLNSQYGHMTADSVREFLGDLQIDLEDLALPEGILDLSLSTEDQETVGDDDTPEVEYEAEPDSKPGMVYELGPHRLIVGDSTKPEDIEKLMAGEKADLIVTDPPYNVDYEGSDGKKIKNDHMEDTSFLNFLVAAFTAMFKVLKNGGVYYIWHADSEGYNFRTAVKQSGGLVRQCIIWVKNSLVLGRQDYQWRHEPCLYGWKEGSGHYWEGRRDLSTVFDETRSDWKKMNKDELIAELKRVDNEIKTSIIYEDKPARNAEHPTMKPVRLFERLIKNSSKEEDIVLDPFGGSGTTIIACAKTNRIARVVEYDPKYADVIRKRWTTWAQENHKEVGKGKLQ
jgi:site-specific DNA-methyltransferase (adenine-specific)